MPLCVTKNIMKMAVQEVELEQEMCEEYLGVEVHSINFVSLQLL